jgi:asparagine synthase (glutamine-hydrolysing)
VVLGATRLAVQDISENGRQPMRSDQTESWIAFNGELYNVDELRRRLIASGHRFKGSSDTEVALRAFDEWGPDAVQQLRGMFALAIWDPRHDRMILARDRLGIKPLYYARQAAGLAFASECRALVAAGFSTLEPSAAGLASFLALGGVREPETILSDIMALPPGHMAIWQAGTTNIREYWSLADAFGCASERTESAVIDELSVLLERAVRRHLISDVPLGVFLSGGIDSSALVSLLASVTDEPPITLSLVFDEQKYSEQASMAAVAKRFGTDHRVARIAGPDVLAALPAALSAMDQPAVDGVNTWLVSRAARACGLTVALSGIGGDEVFAGYSSFGRIPRLNSVRSRIPRPTRPMAASLVSRLRLSHDRSARIAPWLRSTAGTASTYGMVRELFPESVRNQILDGRAALTQASAPPATDALNEVSYLEMNDYMRNVLLRDGDVMSMAHGLEVRVPFLDDELVGFMAGVPGSMKRSPDTPKHLLVKALRQPLPSEIVHRPKMGFELPFAVWLRNSVLPDVERRLLDPDYGGSVRDSLDHDAVVGIWKDFMAGRTTWSRPWGLYALKTWGEASVGVASEGRRIAQVQNNMAATHNREGAQRSAAASENGGDTAC